MYHGEVEGFQPTARIDDEEDGRLLMMEGFQYVIPCVSQEKVVGVILLGRRWDQSALSSEDMELLQTLSGQAATALENARLYRSLELKAEQVERLKEHSENTIESLDAGILVVDLAGKVVRWNRSLEGLYGVRREDALGQRLEELFPGSVLGDPSDEHGRRVVDSGGDDRCIATESSQPPGRREGRQIGRRSFRIRIGRKTRGDHDLRGHHDEGRD